MIKITTTTATIVAIIIRINERTIIIIKINGVNAMDAFLTNYNNTGPPGIDPSTAKQLPLATATLNRWRRNNADLESPDTLLSRRPSSFKKANDCVPHRPSVSMHRNRREKVAPEIGILRSFFGLLRDQCGAGLTMLPRRGERVDTSDVEGERLPRLPRNQGLPVRSSIVCTTAEAQRLQPRRQARRA